ncbi:MAG: UV DNA damage repair endonuclease UvsE [Litorilinea sp.]
MIPVIRLGFPVKVRGARLRSHDSRRWQNQPHLSVSLAYVRDILEYLHTRQIHCYRLAGQLAPYSTHPALPQFHNQIDDCARELAAIGDLARLYNIRLTLHPGFYIQLSSPHRDQVARAAQELGNAAALLDAMGLDDDSVIVVHVGGKHEDGEASRTRFAQAHEKLPARVRRRLALENDDRLFGMDDLVWIHRRTGVRLVLDVLHHACYNPRGYSLEAALTAALATWPAGQTPKIHFSTSRTELRVLMRQGTPVLQMPLPNQHSDFINPFEFIHFVQMAQRIANRPFDIMLEAKAQDLALLRLRAQLAHFAPELLAHIR